VRQLRYDQRLRVVHQHRIGDSDGPAFAGPLYLSIRRRERRVIDCRVAHTASLWKPGERPVLRQQVIEGDPGLSI
jgi:hypothetical protein